MTAPRRFSFGPFVLDAETQVLWRAGDVVPLTPKAVGLLEALVEKRGDVVSKADLLARVWPDTVVEEANLSVTVSAMRRVLGPREDGSEWVETVPRRGYRFGAPVQEAAPRRLALAVLPLRALGVAEEHLGLGMADALINRLLPIPGLLVRPTGAVMRYAGKSVDPAAVAAELGVDAIIEGSIQRDASRLRVSVRLVPRGEGVTPWASSFDVPFTDLFAVEDAIAERVTSALLPRLEPSGSAGLPKGVGYVPKLAAYEAYLRGRLFWSRFDGEGLGRAVDCFREAAELDPGYAEPHAGLADVFLVVGFAGIAPPRAVWPDALAEAEEALRLDPDVAEARIALGYLRLFQDWDWTGSRRELDRAAATSPNSVAVRQWRALFLAMAGDLAGARIEIARARERDPVSLIPAAVAALLSSLAGDEEELAAVRRAVELEPGRFLAYWSLGLACVHAGRFEEAVEAHRRAVVLADDAPVMKAVLAWTLARAGQPDEARASLAAAAAGHLSAYQHATVLAALGDKDEALARLDAAAADRDPWMTWIKVDPMLDPLRGDPRLARLVERVFAPAG